MSAPLPPSAPAPTSSSIPVKELLPYCACICFMTSCYTEFPDCIGCAGKRICLCCYSDIMSCKLPKDDEEDIWCHIDKGHTYCGPITTCCMQRAQMFCLDVRCSLPLSDDIPVLITCCFFTLYFKDEFGPFMCFRTIRELEEDVAELSRPPAAGVPRAPVRMGAPTASAPAPARPAPASAQVSSGTQTSSSQTSGTQTSVDHTTSSPLAPPVQNA